MCILVCLGCFGFVTVSCYVGTLVLTTHLKLVATLLSQLPKC